MWLQSGFIVLQNCWPIHRTRWIIINKIVSHYIIKLQSFYEKIKEDIYIFFSSLKIGSENWKKKIKGLCKFLWISYSMQESFIHLFMWVLSLVFIFYTKRGVTHLYVSEAFVGFEYRIEYGLQRILTLPKMGTIDVRRDAHSQYKTG